MNRDAAAGSGSAVAESDSPAAYNGMAAPSAAAPRNSASILRIVVFMARAASVDGVANVNRCKSNSR